VDFHTEKYRAFYDRILTEIKERRRSDEQWSKELDLQLANILAVYASTHSVPQFFLITLSGSYVRFDRYLLISRVVRFVRLFIFKISLVRKGCIWQRFGRVQSP
jgi:hypothetical protein